MEDLITCSICLRKYDDPRVLPCQHTFCLKPCLERIFELSLRQIKCPLCRSVHHLSKGFVNSLPKNLTIQSIIDIASESVDKPKKNCGTCGSMVRETRSCECCHGDLCRSCCDIHLGKTKESLIKFGETLKRNLVTEKDSFNRIINDLTSIENDKSKLLSSINHLFNEINSILQQRKLELIKDVTKVYEPALNRLRSLTETKEIDIAVLSSSLQSMDVVKKESISHGHLLSLYTSIQATLPATTQSYCSKKSVRTGTFLYDIESITNHISTFGELTWPDDTVSESPLLPLDIPCSSTDMTEKHEASNMIIIDSSNNNQSARLNREKTFVLNRPPKSISYEIPNLVAQGTSNLVTLQARYQTKSLPIITFGSKGTGNGEFIWPRGVAVDNDSNKIIVADSSNHRIQIFSDKGIFEKVIANLTCDQLSDDMLLTFDCLSGIAIGKENVIVCSDRYNHRAIVMDFSGRLLHELGKNSTENARLSYPWGIAIDSNQNILICDKDNHRIQVFSKTGDYIKEIGSHGRQTGMFDNPHYLAICPKTKNIFVSDTSNHRIQVFSPNGIHLYSFGGEGPTKFHLKYPRGIAVDNDGNVLICDYGNNRISIFSNQGKSLYIFGSHGNNSGQFKGLEGIAVFKDGRIVVSDRDNHRIQIF